MKMTRTAGGGGGGVFHHSDSFTVNLRVMWGQRNERMNRLTGNRSESLSRIRSSPIPGSEGDLTWAAPPGLPPYRYEHTPTQTLTHSDPKDSKKDPKIRPRSAGVHTSEAVGRARVKMYFIRFLLCYCVCGGCFQDAAERQVNSGSWQTKRQIERQRGFRVLTETQRELTWHQLTSPASYLLSS